MGDLRLRVHLDPVPADRALLAAYPATELWPDFGVVTSGALAIDLGGRAIAYHRGHLIDRPAGADDPAVWLPDYLGAFLQRLVDAVLGLRPETPTSAHLLDAPAALAFHQIGGEATVTYLDRGQPAALTSLPVTALRAVVRQALTAFLADLLAINPRLANHPEVAALRRDLAALAALPEERPC